MAKRVPDGNQPVKCKSFRQNRFSSQAIEPDQQVRRIGFDPNSADFQAGGHVFLLREPRLGIFFPADLIDKPGLQCLQPGKYATV